jgi:hypothetical protein
MGKRTPEATAAAAERAKILRVKLAAARKDAFAAGRAAGFKLGRSAGYIDGSRATWRGLYKNCDAKMAVYLCQISMGRRDGNFTDPTEIEARSVAVARAEAFYERVVLGTKSKSVRRGQEGSIP